MSLTVGDTAPVMTGRLTKKQDNGTYLPVLLTGATLEVHFRRPDNTVVSRAASIVSGVDGTWSMPLEDGDLTDGGDYELEVQVTYADSSIQTFAQDTDGRDVAFEVRRQIA